MSELWLWQHAISIVLGEADFYTINNKLIALNAKGASNVREMAHALLFASRLNLLTAVNKRSRSTT
jgi:hypothetical protein